MGAQHLTPAPAKFTFPAGKVEIDYRMLSNMTFINAFSDLDDLPGYLMPENMGNPFVEGWIPFQILRSVLHTPQALTLRTTSPAPGVGTERSRRTNGALNSSSTMHFIILKLSFPSFNKNFRLIKNAQMQGAPACAEASAGRRNPAVGVNS